MVASPIGNLKDLTFRAQQVLELVDYVACEDTRVSAKLLNSLELSKTLFSCNAHSEANVVHKIIRLLKDGHSVAYLSDAGTPGLADPGNLLVEEVIKAGLKVIPIPGPSSVATILSVCGFNLSKGFHFGGFLPRSEGKLKKLLNNTLLDLKTPLVALEAPYRIRKSLQIIASVFPQADICLGRELTKFYEEIIRGSCREVADGKWLEKGEFTLVIHLDRKEAKQLQKQRANPSTDEEVEDEDETHEL